MDEAKGLNISLKTFVSTKNSIIPLLLIGLLDHCVGEFQDQWEIPVEFVPIDRAFGQ